MAQVRTHPGIRRRILIAFILLTILPAGIISYLGMRAVGGVIEERLVRERARNAARVVSEMRLPLTPLMFERLSEMFGEQDEVAAELNGDAVGESLVSSLNEADQKELANQLHGRASLLRSVWVHGREYVMGASEIRDVNGQGHALYLLVDQQVLADAKAAAVRPILLGAIPVLVAVIAAAFYVSRTITQPIRRLSAQIEGQVSNVGSTATNVSVDAGAGSELRVREVNLDAPRELADLATTFNRMLVRLRETQERLLEAERLAAVGKVAASVAHEIRNPLAGIGMNLQLLEQHLAKKGIGDEALKISIGEVERLDSIVQEMLILGRKAKPKLQRVDVGGLVAEVLSLLGRRLEHGGVVAKVEGGVGDGLVRAMSDPAQIKQVLLNLMINASDAMPQGGELVVRVLGVEDGCRVEIDDSGAGMMLSEGADPFAWFSTTKSAGSGIGLAVCRQIIEGHGGRIGLERLDRGTRAWFELKGGERGEGAGS